MVITLVTEILTFSEVVLPDRVKSFVVEVFREPAKSKILAKRKETSALPPRS